MFKEAFAVIDKETSIREEQFEVEIQVYETGDYAVTCSIFYFTKDIKNILNFRQYVKKIILKTSKKKEISLATPVLQDAEVKVASGNLNT